MNKNKIILLLASTLTTATLVTLPIVAMVNNVSSNANLVTNNDVNEVIGSEDFDDSDYSTNEISEKENSDFNNELISEIDNEINNEINVNQNNEQTAAQYFDVYQNDLINAGWGDITTKGTHLTFEVILDGDTDDTRQVRLIKPQVTFRAENFSIQSTIHDHKTNKTYKVVEVAASAFESPVSGAILSGSLTIGNNIKTIGNRAFYYQSNITSLNLGSSISSISDYAFYNCQKLAGNLTIPDNITSIGNHAFYDCAHLTKLMLGNNVKTIDEFAFSGCSMLTGDLIIPDSVTSLGVSAFRNCGFDENFVIGSGLKIIPDSYFKNYINFKGCLTIKNGVEIISDNAFSGCSGFSSIIIGNTVTSIGKYAFESCTGLKGDLIIPDSVTTIDVSSFNKCVGFDGNLVIGKGLKNIPNSIFKDFNFLGTLTIESGVETIGQSSFFNCKFSNIIIKNGLKKIYGSAFCNNTKLIGTLIIPNSVNLIDKNAFENCGINTLIIQGPENNDPLIIKGLAFANCFNLEMLIFEKNIAFDYQNAFSIYGDVDYPFEGCPITHVSYFCTKPPSILSKKSYHGIDTIWNRFVNGPVILNSKVPQVDGATFVNCSKDAQDAFRNATRSTKTWNETVDKKYTRHVWEAIPAFPESTFNDTELACEVSYLDLENKEINSKYNAPLIYQPLFSFSNGGDAFKNDVTWKINNFSSEECAEFISLNETSGEITISPGLVAGNYYFDVSGWTSNGLCLAIHKVSFKVVNYVHNIQIDNTDVDATYIKLVNQLN